MHSTKPSSQLHTEDYWLFKRTNQFFFWREGLFFIICHRNRNGFLFVKNRLIWTNGDSLQMRIFCHFLLHELREAR